MSAMATLIWAFFKVGLFAVGGGAATIPFLMEMAEQYPWFTMEELSDMIAISEGTPGPLGVNMATYAGFQALGVVGGLVATLSLIAPSVVIILIIARFLAGFQNNRTVQAVFAGIKPAVTGLIAAAVLAMFRVSLFAENEGVLTPRVGVMVLCVVIFALLQWPKAKKWHPGVWFLAAMLVGIVFQM